MAIKIRYASRMNVHPMLWRMTSPSLRTNLLVETPTLAVCGATHRDSYRDIVVVGIIGALVALAAVIALGSLVGSF